MPYLLYGTFRHAQKVNWAPTIAAPMSYLALRKNPPRNVT